MEHPLSLPLLQSTVQRVTTTTSYKYTLTAHSIKSLLIHSTDVCIWNSTIAAIRIMRVINYYDINTYHIHALRRQHVIILYIISSFTGHVPEPIFPLRAPSLSLSLSLRAINECCRIAKVSALEFTLKKRYKLQKDS
jgi:hypothetical protein